MERFGFCLQLFFETISSQWEKKQKKHDFAKTSFVFKFFKLLEI